MQVTGRKIANILNKGMNWLKRLVFLYQRLFSYHGKTTRITSHGKRNIPRHRLSPRG